MDSLRAFSESSFGFGAMRLSCPQALPKNQAIEILHAALDSGVRVIDTADSYCSSRGAFGENERLIQEALVAYGNLPPDLLVVTKGGLQVAGDRSDWKTPHFFSRDSSAAYLRSSIRRSFESLGGKRPIPLWLHHAPDGKHPVSEVMQVAAEAQQQGLIRHIGVSNYKLAELKEALSVARVSCIQNKLNPLFRGDIESGLLRFCEQQEILYLAWAPLGGTFHKTQCAQLEWVQNLARETGASFEEILLSWCRSRSRIVLPLVGSTNLQHLMALRPQYIRREYRW